MLKLLYTQNPNKNSGLFQVYLVRTKFTQNCILGGNLETFHFPSNITRFIRTLISLQLRLFWY